MLANEFYSVVEDAAGRVRGQLHQLREDGWSPPLPEGVEPPPELAMRSTLATGLTRAVARSDTPPRPSWLLGGDHREPWRLVR